MHVSCIECSVSEQRGFEEKERKNKSKLKFVKNNEETIGTALDNDDNHHYKLSINPGGGYNREFAMIVSIL